MINFLRKIRNRFIEQQNAKKYFLYAFGEIILIVIGILIALQINNWNTNRNTLNTEKQLLKGIKSDLISDTLQIDNRFYWAYNRRVRYFKQYDSLVKVYDSKPNIRYVDSIFALCVLDMNTFFPSSGTYNEVISSGRSNIFTNDSLFKKIQRLYDVGYEILISEGQFIDELTYDIQLDFSSRIYYPENWRRDFYINPDTRGKAQLYFENIKKFQFNIKLWRKDIEDLIGDIENELQSD